ncbi:MAG: hypothetical protein AB8C84_08320 [Oligoflexales bacterium]
MIKKFCSLVAVAVLVCGCQDWTQTLEDFDVISFLAFGDSILDVETPSSLKELHLNDEKADGDRVILSGHLLTRDKFKTYGVLEDDSGRMLTVFTELKYGWDLLSEDAGQVRVFGKVEMGQGGVRILKAIALTRVAPQSL